MTNSWIKKTLACVFAILVLTPNIMADGKKILFTGDSITDGNWGGTERSLTDMNHIYGHGYMFICAARYMANYPGENYRFYNRGLSGNKVVDLKNRWEKDAIEIDPDILTILIGVNDLNNVYNQGENAEMDFEQFERDYRELLDRSRSKNPDLKIVLCEPFIFPVGIWLKNYPHWREQCDRMSEVIHKLSKEYNAVWLPFQDLFDQLAEDPQTPSLTYWMWDGIHPTAAGHEKMAEMWINAMGQPL